MSVGAGEASARRRQFVPCLIWRGLRRAFGRPGSQLRARPTDPIDAPAKAE